ncbi:MAG: FkbM family methyltransferase [Calditrichaceae bacterium]|nr:FkbM family methyltransferase [Calditrichaceae bacterium]MBN2710124.1 FkbM family methyltransferase [Calditrichaceae bacterium]RQV93429.1 MAG: FkbM family methyltransferase [Calditrichota bacterium]
MKAEQMINKIVSRLKGTSKTKHKKGKYKIGKYEIEIPPDFALPVFQQSFKLYDRFLPVLAKNLNGEKVIIDVGANIGDTAIAMIQNCKNPVICIEPSDTFFSYLEKNLLRIESEYPSRVKTFKTLVGTGLITGFLDHTKGGTASLKVTKDSDSITHVALDKIIDDVSNILLLKVDTDGYDFDVIRSAEEILSHSEPILFWENEISEDFQHTGFNDLYDLLEKKGYKYIYIFDNFGNLMTEEATFATLRNINSYVYSMKKYNCTRTIYYTDILASTEKNSIFVKKAIDEYKSEWINK